MGSWVRFRKLDDGCFFMELRSGGGPRELDSTWEFGLKIVTFLTLEGVIPPSSGPYGGALAFVDEFGTFALTLVVFTTLMFVRLN